MDPTPDVPFVGRGAELASLRSQLLAVPAGGTRVVLLSGEAAVGKSRLVAEFVATATADDAGPGVELVEDVHLLDVDAIAGLGDRPHAGSRLVVATIRGGVLEPRSPRRQALLDLRRRPDVVEMDLDGLTTSEVAELLDVLGVDDDPAAVHRWTGGNPFFIQELARAEDAFPWTIRDMIGQQLAGLSDDDRRALLALAMANGPLPPDVVRAVAPDADLATLVERRLIRSNRGRDTMSLRHGAVAEDLRVGLDAPAVQALHRQLAEALAGTPGADAEDVWHHRVVAGDVVAARTTALRTAMAAAQGGRPQHAMAWFERALDRTDDVEPDVVAQAAMVAGAVGRAEHAERWARVADRGFRAAGRSDDAERMWSDRSLRYIRRPGARSSGLEALAGQAEQAELAARAGDLDAARALAEQVMGDSHPLHDSDHAARAALAVYMAGDPSRAVEVLKELRNEAFDAGDSRLEAWRSADLAACAAGLGDIAEGIAYERVALAAMTGLDDELLVPSLHVGLACLLGIAGHLDDARDVAADLSRHPSPFTGFLAMVPDMIIAISEGDHDRALRHAATLEPFKDIAGPYLFGILLAVQAFGLYMTGDHGASTTVLDELDDWVGGVFHQTMPIRLELRARIAAAAADHAALQRVHDRAAELAGHPLAGPGLTGNRELAIGMQRRLAGDPGGAVPHLRAAADAFSRDPRRLATGLTWCDAADAALDHGDVEAATELLARAVQVRDEYGMQALGERIAEVRARLTTTGFQLTPRETQLLSLVATGMTNKDIAAELFLSPRTVRNHLSSLFAKLGVGRRAEAAALAVRLELAGPEDHPEPGDPRES